MSVTNEVVPAELGAVVRLFEESLAGVAFPDVNADALRGMAEAVRRAAVEVERARSVLEAAELAADEATAQLRRAAERGLAYARIYADADPTRQPLRVAIERTGEAVTPPVAPAAPTGKKRGRPRKVAEDSLFGAPAADEA